MTHPEDGHLHPPRRIIVTGGCGFIGSSLVRYLCQSNTHSILNLDCLTYASSLTSLGGVAKKENYQHVRLDIREKSSLMSLLGQFKPDLIFHLAAESHVDRSIDNGEDFVTTNVQGTYNLLHACLEYWERLRQQKKDHFRFHHISTDEIYGSLGSAGRFTEKSPSNPSNPYSASKAGSNHLVQAWNCTYGLPTITTNCSNNYGPFQFPEKLIPVIILNALSRKPIPIYGSGDNIRDWLYVQDHIEALWIAANHGQPGSTYNIGGNEEHSNLQIARKICEILNDIRPHRDGCYSQLIQFVADRPGHDKRYAIDATKIRNELNWAPKTTFESGLSNTVKWYLDNEWWWRPIRDQVYAGERLGQKSSR